MIIFTMIILISGGCYLAILGYHNYRLFQMSRGTFEQEVHFERQGSFSILADPPGRSLFRPGGIIRIFVDGPESLQESEVFVSHVGKGTLRVVDRSGRVALEEIWLPYLKDIRHGEGNLSDPRRSSTRR
jgi:hypothetical protein